MAARAESLTEPKLVFVGGNFWPTDAAQESGRGREAPFAKLRQYLRSSGFEPIHGYTEIGRATNLAEIFHLEEMGGTLTLVFKRCCFHEGCPVAGRLPFGAVVIFDHCEFRGELVLNDLEWTAAPDGGESVQDQAHASSDLREARAPVVVLHNCHIQRSLAVNRCDFWKLRIGGGTINEKMEIRGSRFLHSLNVERTSFGSAGVDLFGNTMLEQSFLRDCTFPGPLNILGCRFEQQLDFWRSRFAGDTVRLDSVFDEGISFRSCRSTSGAFAPMRRSSERTSRMPSSQTSSSTRAASGRASWIGVPLAWADTVSPTRPTRAPRGCSSRRIFGRRTGWF